MYGLSKLQKRLINNFPEGILSAINTATYSWAKFFVALLSFTTNEYMLRDSFDFAKHIINQNSGCFIASLDVVHFLQVLDEAIKICNELFKFDSVWT